MERDDPAYGGQSEYTPFFLKIYDPLILGFFTRVVWRCPTTLLVERYRRHIRPRHLDVGPGTGYFLERAGLPDGQPRHHPRPECARPRSCLPAPAAPGHHGGRGRRLQAAAHRWTVRLRRAERRDPLPTGTALAQGCGRGQRGCRPRADWRPLRRIDPRDFRATHLVVAEILDANNRRGIFDNLGDTQEGLREILEASFEQVELETVGSMAIFAAMNPRT